MSLLVMARNEPMCDVSVMCGRLSLHIASITPRIASFAIIMHNKQAALFARRKRLPTAENDMHMLAFPLRGFQKLTRLTIE